jgi:hypothetical protein
VVIGYKSSKLKAEREKKLSVTGECPAGLAGNNLLRPDTPLPFHAHGRAFSLRDNHMITFAEKVKHFDK